MEIEKQIEIANSFSDEYEESILNIELTFDEFDILKEGIFSNDMDDKWNIFVLNQYLYFSRSWTDVCVYKVHLTQNQKKVILDNIRVTRDSNQYKIIDLKSDIDLFKELLQIYLNREGLYKDERFNIGLIKETIEKYDNNDINRKSIGFQSIDLNLQIYNSLLESNKERVQVDGFEDFKKNSLKYNKNYELYSLHISKKVNPKEATTYFFNQDATELIGQITIKRI